MTNPTPAQTPEPVCREARGCDQVVLCQPGCGARDLLAEATQPPVDDAARLRAALTALHQPMQRGPFTICEHCSGWDGKWQCRGVVTDWPCPTMRAVDATAAVPSADQPARSDVGSEFVRQADQPDETGLAAWEADLTADRATPSADDGQDDDEPEEYDETDSDGDVLDLISEIAGRLQDATDSGEYHASVLIGDLATGRTTCAEAREELDGIEFGHA